MASRLPAKSLTIDAPSIATVGTTIEVTVTGLDAGEKVTIKVGSTTLLTSTAPASGPAKLKVPLGSTTAGSKTLVATGAATNRTGSRAILLAKLGGATTLTKRI